MNKIEFKKLTIDDMPLFKKWTEVPDVKNTWFQDGYDSLEKYEKEINGNGYDYGFIIYLNETPIGYIQTSDLYAYKTICKNPKGVFTNEQSGTFCVDLFIGEEKYLNKGYGTEIVKAFTQKLFKDFKAKKILIDPASSNKRAIRCYEKAGFEIIRREHDGTTECCIMQWFPPYKLKLVETKAEWAAYHRIRRTEIFDRMDKIEYDYNHPSLTSPTNHHYVFYVGEEIIGTFQLEILSDNEAAIRAVAICGNNKNKGYGSILLKLGEAEIKKQGIKTIHLHAYPKAYNFYKRAGYVDMAFDEVAIYEDDIDMGKVL